jgi:hypothetical protein
MKSLKWALLVAPIIAMSASAATPAIARTGVSIDLGNIAVGYRDGYYDRSHSYHRWGHADAMRYRDRYHDNYRDMAHSRDHNRGW